MRESLPEKFTCDRCGEEHETYMDLPSGWAALSYGVDKERKLYSTETRTIGEFCITCALGYVEHVMSYAEYKNNKEQS